mmetsp:Transcript_27378/g.61910  ORF Transcript_27378/g.61910 Transcript_27378/m.61910 type:complete len:84 (-) Transcript_27378:127-378(-)
MSWWCSSRLERAIRGIREVMEKHTDPTVPTGADGEQDPTKAAALAEKNWLPAPDTRASHPCSGNPSFGRLFAPRVCHVSLMIR